MRHATFVERTTWWQAGLQLIGLASLLPLTVGLAWAIVYVVVGPESW